MKIKCFQLLQAQRKTSLAIGFTKAECIVSYLSNHTSPVIGNYPSKVRKMYELIREGHFLFIECDVTPVPKEPKEQAVKAVENNYWETFPNNLPTNHHG